MKVYVTGTITENTGAYRWFYDKAKWNQACAEDREFAVRYDATYVEFELETKGDTREEINAEVETYWNENY